MCWLFDTQNRLNRQQKDKVTQFRSITGASDKQAIDCLKQAGWGVEGGIEVFFSMGMQGGSVLDTRAIEQLYSKYKGKASSSLQEQCTRVLLSVRPQRGSRCAAGCVLKALCSG
ncbi:hypothetical protein COO60DRAFT_415085 [Scenedesmus sp. NREL 46B-D3]|nr:hypothetical protein COO60DRAFT_415085 [Scenedesmus sp. NREL 46B-D3]